MAFWKDFIKSELIDIVEWLDDSSDTLVHRFVRHENEIKNGAQLIVRPGQAAVFVDQGRIADVFAPGRYELTTENLPCSPPFADGSMASTRPSRRRCTSSPRGRSPTASGAQRTR
jgi:membrane protease subunit (stomatin/prohibitin family)